MSDAASSSSSSVGAFGGEKKLKKDSVGTVFLTTRVCFVSEAIVSLTQQYQKLETYSCYAASCSQSVPSNLCQSSSQSCHLQHDRK